MIRGNQDKHTRHAPGNSTILQAHEFKVEHTRITSTGHGWRGVHPRAAERDLLIEVPLRPDPELTDVLRTFPKVLYNLE